MTFHAGLKGEVGLFDIFEFYCLNKLMFRLQASEKYMQKRTRLVKVHNSLPEFLARFI